MSMQIRVSVIVHYALFWPWFFIIKMFFHLMNHASAFQQAKGEVLVTQFLVFFSLFPAEA